MNRSNLLTLLIVAVVATGFWLLSPTHAQPAGPAGRANIAIVNVPTVFRSCKETVAMNRDLEERTKQIQSATEAQAQRIKKMEEDARKMFDPSGQDYKNKMNELITERIRMRVTLEEQQRDLMMQQQMRAERFYAKINDKIKAISVAEGYDLVLFHEDTDIQGAKSPEQLLDAIRQRKVLYNSQRADITKQVIDRLDVEFSETPAKN